MAITIEEFWRGSQDQPFAIAQRTVEQLRQIPMPPQLNYIGLLCSKAIIQRDNASLEIIRNGPELDSPLENEEQATFVNIARVANIALEAPRSKVKFGALRGDPEIIDSLVGTAVQGPARLTEELSHLLIDAMKNNDSATLRVIFYHAQRALDPSITAEDDIDKRGRLSAVILVAKTALQYHIPQAGHEEES